MEAFILSYGFDFSSFQETSKLANAFVAGSAPLSIYLENLYKPGDMDIFLNGISHRNIMRDYLVQHGYTNTKKFENDIYRYSMDYIICIDSFCKEEKEIQIITLDVMQHVTEYISCLFDISVCATWWDPFENQIVTLNPELTSQKIMYINFNMSTCFTYVLSEKLRDRITKYIERGFTLINIPYINTFKSADYRKNIIQSILSNTTAFDVCAYEDVNCIQFLKKSILNIIIKTGKQLQAFHRNTLFTYMLNHRHLIDTKYIFTTPTQQCIYAESLSIFLYCDYSIFEFIDPVNHVDSNGDIQTVYSLGCYTVNQWNIGIPDEILKDTRPVYDNEQYYENIYEDENDSI